MKDVQHSAIPLLAERLRECPECKEKSLHCEGMRGRDDYGELEGERSWCEKCGYLDEWAARC